MNGILARVGDRFHRTFSRDPRYYQLFCQSAIYAYGLKYLDFALYLGALPVAIAGCLVTQAAAIFTLRWLRPHSSNQVRARFDWRSPTVSAMSLALLLRSNELWPIALAAVLSIGSKFVLRASQRHFFNPSLFGILAVLLLIPQHVWVSPGQWGREGLLLFFVACAGGVVLFRALRSDVTFAFLLSFAALLITRAVWLGDPWPIVQNQLSSGTLLIFAFFMISDPKSTPLTRGARIGFAALTAGIAVFIQFGLYGDNALLWALGWAAFTVPLWNLLRDAQPTSNSDELQSIAQAAPPTSALAGAQT